MFQKKVCSEKLVLVFSLLSNKSSVSYHELPNLLPSQKICSAQSQQKMIEAIL